MLSALFAGRRGATPKGPPAPTRRPHRFVPRLTELEARDVPSATFSLDGNKSATEGGTLQFFVNAVGSNHQGATVSYTVTRNSGTGNDFAGPMAGKVVFGKNDNRPKPITFRAVDDRTDEPSESFTVTLTSVTHGFIGGPSSATGTIFDNDPPPTVNLIGATRTSEASGHVNYTARLSARSEFEVTVFFQTVSASPTMNVGTDLTTLPGQVVFLPGTTTAPIRVGITNDDIVEPTETFTVQATGGLNVQIGGTSSISTQILDDDKPIIGLAMGNLTRFRGQNVTFTLFLMNRAERPVTLKYWTVDQSARNGVDYNGVNSSFTFGPGAEQTEVTIGIPDDKRGGRLQKKFLFRLSSPGAILPTSSVTITIIDMIVIQGGGEE